MPKAALFFTALASCGGPTPRGVSASADHAHGPSAPSTGARDASPPSVGAPPPTFADSPHPPADRVVQVAVGSRYGCALRQSGAVDCWGTLPNATEITGPVRLAGIDDGVELAASGFIACVRSRTGKVGCIMPGAPRDGGRPTLVPIDGIAGAESIAVGMGGLGTGQTEALTVCARDRAGGVMCWSAMGKLPRTRPKALRVRGLAPAREIVVNYDFGSYACALDAGGAMRCWQITPAADGSPEDGAPSPLAVGAPWLVRGLPPLARAAVSWRSGVGVQRDGKAIAFVGPEGAPGDRDHLPARFAPSAVVPLSSFDGAEKLLGRDCAVLADGRAVCAREGGVISPVPVARPTSVAVGNTVYAETSCAVATDGRVMCWGGNDGGALAAPTTIPTGSPEPITVVDLEGVEDIAVSEHLSCALRSDSSVHCWGAGTTVDPRERRSVPRPFATAVRSIFGGATICMRLSDGHLECFKRGVSSAQQTPVRVGNLARVEDAWAGDSRVFVRVPGGAVRALDPWTMLFDRKGADSPFLLSASDCGLTRAPPSPVVCRVEHELRELGIGPVSKIAPGRRFGCGLETSGHVWCWGAGLPGAPAEARPAGPPQPWSPLGELSDAVDLASSSQTLCVRRRGGAVQCVGTGEDLRLPRPNDFSPGAAAPLLTGATRIALGETHGCALFSTGRVKCFGRNYEGELGDGSIDRSDGPVPVPLR